MSTHVCTASFFFFAKVKQLIQDMIVKLQEEAQAKATESVV